MRIRIKGLGFEPPPPLQAAVHSTTIEQFGRLKDLECVEVILQKGGALHPRGITIGIAVTIGTETLFVRVAGRDFGSTLPVALDRMEAQLVSYGFITE